MASYQRALSDTCKALHGMEGAQMEYKIVSGDGHMDLAWRPPDLFVSDAPATWKNVVPQGVETAEGGRWYAEGKNLAALALGAASGLPNRALPQRGVGRHQKRWSWKRWQEYICAPNVRGVRHAQEDPTIYPGITAQFNREGHRYSVLL